MAASNPHPEFVAVILAGTVGTRLYSVSSTSLPKHLLPVVGISLLVRQLNALVVSSFSECVIALANGDKHTAREIEDADGIQQLSGNRFLFKDDLTVLLHYLPSDCPGSFSALRDVEEASCIPASSHIVVLPGDLFITDTNVITKLANSHREGRQDKIKSSCTMLLVDVGEDDVNGNPLKESAKAKKNSFYREEDQIEYIGLSMRSKNDDTPRVVLKQLKVDVEEDVDMVGTAPKLHFPKPRLLSEGITRIKTSWHDVHVYIFSPWIRKLFLARSSFVSLKGDLIPFLVEAQFLGIQNAFGNKKEAMEIYNEFFSLPSVESKNVAKLDDDEFAVRTCVFGGEKVMRACTLPSYLLACRKLLSIAASDDEIKDTASLSLPNGAVLNNKLKSVVLKDTELGEKVQIKHSVVGSGAKLGSKCKLNNVILMDNVTLGDNVILQNAVVGERCVIGENCSLSYVRIARDKSIPPGTKEKGDLSIDEI